MTNPKTPPHRKPESAQPDEQDEAARARALILQRRNRFMAAALAGLGAASGACSDSHGPDDNPPSDQSGRGGQGDAASGGTESGRGGRAGGGGVGARPSVCLSGSTAPPPQGGTGGTMPQVCLDVALCPDNEPPPCVCLTAPIEEDAGTDDGSQG